MLRYTLARPWRMLLAFNRFLAGTRRTGFQVLLLHDVTVAQRPALEQLLDYIEQRYGFLTPENAAKLIDGRPSETNNIPCLLTFDDGFISNLDVARDILGPRRLKALFFICPGLMAMSETDQRQAIADNIFQGRVDGDDLREDQTLMTWEDIDELHSMGHSIGSHGMTHKRLSDLTGDALMTEILDAGEAIKKKIGEPCPWYAYAFGLDTPFTYQKLVLDGGLDIRYGRSCIRLFQMLGHARSSTEQHSVS